MKLSQETLKSELHYDPATGLFTRARAASTFRKVGEVAGGADRNGHIRISIGNRLYSAHRLAWLYVYGIHPSGAIDHINGNRSDNRIANLRDVTLSVNQQNQRAAQKHNSTGLLGVTFNKARGRFQAQIGLGKDRRYLGLFDTAEAAHAAYVTAKRALHEGCTI